MIGTMTAVPAPAPFAQAEASAATLKRLAGAPDFDAAVVLGSGWLAAADAIGAAELEVPLADLGGVEEPTTAGPGARPAIAAGCRTVVLTNAAGGINPAYGVGQPVLISDHLNLTGRSP